MTSTAEVPAAVSQATSAEPRVPLPVRGWHAVTFAVRALGDIWRTFRTARPRDRLGLTAAVLRIRSKHFLWKLSHRWTFRCERVFGWTFDCFEYYDMFTTFEIVFLLREYRFTPQTPRPRIVDCGSNIGLSLLFFKREYPESTILAFEPDPDTFAVLRRNVERNTLSGIELHNRALAGTPGVRDFYADSTRPGSTGMSLSRKSGLDRCTTVQCVKLSDYIKQEVDFLKLDIEGMELDVVQDLVESGKIQHVNQMVVEYHPALFPHRDGYSWLRKMLQGSGFEVQLRSGSLISLGSSIPPPLTLFAERRASSGSARSVK